MCEIYQVTVIYLCPNLTKIQLLYIEVIVKYSLINLSQSKCRNLTSVVVVHFTTNIPSNPLMLGQLKSNKFLFIVLRVCTPVVSIYLHVRR